MVRPEERSSSSARARTMSGSRSRHAPAGSSLTRASTCIGCRVRARRANRSRSSAVSMKRAPAVARRTNRHRIGRWTAPAMRIGMAAMRDAEPEGEPLDGRHLAAAGLGERVGGTRRAVERRGHVVTDDRHTPQVVARVRQRPRQARRRLGRLPSWRGQGHRRVVDLVPDPDPQHQPEHEQQVGDDLGGPAAGGVGIELHGAHRTRRREARSSVGTQRRSGTQRGRRRGPVRAGFSHAYDPEREPQELQRLLHAGDRLLRRCSLRRPGGRLLPPGRPVDQGVLRPARSATWSPPRSRWPR